MRLRDFDRVELAVFVVSYGSLLALGGLLAYLNVSWWVIGLWFVAAFALLMVFQGWYERRHPTTGSDEDPPAEG